MQPSQVNGMFLVDEMSKMPAFSVGISDLATRPSVSYCRKEANHVNTISFYLGHFILEG
jgi:hypothetical protein